MNARTVWQLALALALATGVGGIGLGVAGSWGGSAGIIGMCSAALIGFLAAAAGIGFVAVLRDAGSRPPHTPPALHWALGTAVLVAVSAMLLLFVLKPAPSSQLATWCAIHCVLQGIWLVVLFRRGGGSGDAP